VKNHLPGVRSGKKIGIVSFIAVKSAGEQKKLPVNLRQL
jgi:hypothetical protein